MANEQAPKFRYDYKAINRDVPIRSVIEQYSGEPINRNGVIHCISQSHNDSKPSMKIYEHTNNCKCFSCGANFSPVDAVMELTGVQSYVAARQLIDTFLNGNLHEYSNADEVDKYYSQKRSGKFVDCFPLSKEETEFIGLTYKSEEPKYPISELEYDCRMNNLMTADEFNMEQEISTLTEHQKEFYLDKYGLPKQRKCTFDEMVQMQFFSKDMTKSDTPLSLPELWKPKEEQRVINSQSRISGKEPYKEVISRRKEIEQLLLNKCDEKYSACAEIIANEEDKLGIIDKMLTPNNIKASIALHRAFCEYTNKGIDVTLNTHQKNLLTLYDIYSKVADDIKDSINSIISPNNLGKNMTKEEKLELRDKYFNLNYIKETLVNDCVQAFDKATDEMYRAAEIKEKILCHSKERENSYKKNKSEVSR